MKQDFTQLHLGVESANECSDNMSSLRKALKAFAEKHEGQLPTSVKWCDILITEGNVSKETFICPYSNVKLGQSSYALNENIISMKLSHIPREVVLLFETSEGWNQVGGAELVTFDNHMLLDEKCFNVILARGRRGNSSKARLHELRWKSENK